MNNKSYVLKGNICYSKSPEELVIEDSSYIVAIDGISKGVFKDLPMEYKNLELRDCGQDIIMPGLIDLHLHAPQYAFRGLGMDMELLEWLNTHAFPEESKYSDIEYAKKAYSIFTEDVRRGASTRLCVFASLHVFSTEILMDMLDKAGIFAYVGRVNMDRNSPEYLCEESAEKAASDTINFIEATKDKYKYVKPIITPRFIPSCSDELMVKLAEIQKKYKLPVQSHLSENPDEIEWVKQLCPWSDSYGEAYDKFGLFGKYGKTIMAHCVHSSDEEIALIKKRGVYIAHCPESNMNLASGIAPVRRYIDEGIHIGFGSDVAGGTDSSIFKAMSECIRVSKLRWRILDQSLKPLNIREVIYMATKGGGSFFGKVGSFEPGYEFDAIIIDDSNIRHPQKLNTRERLERIIYLSDTSNIKGKYIAGNKLF